MTDFSQTPYYTMTYLLDNQKQRPHKVRLETWGYGGIGVAFLEVQSGSSRRYIPSKVTRVAGKVNDAANILVDDTRWTFLGEPDSTKSFLAPEFAGHRHILEIRLAPAAD